MLAINPSQISVRLHRTNTRERKEHTDTLFRWIHICTHIRIYTNITQTQISTPSVYGRNKRLHEFCAKLVDWTADTPTGR
jgi:regulator of sigma D